jgi:hypothetical protein
MKKFSNNAIRILYHIRHVFVFFMGSLLLFYLFHPPLPPKELKGFSLDKNFLKTFPSTKQKYSKQCDAYG